MENKKQNKWKIKQPSIAFSIIILIFALCCQMLSMKASADYLEKLEQSDRDKYQECFERYKNLSDKKEVQHYCFCAAEIDRQDRTIDALGLVFETIRSDGAIVTFDITHKDFINHIGDTKAGCWLSGPTWATTKERCENFGYFSQVGGAVFPYDYKDLDRKICSKFNNK